MAPVRRIILTRAPTKEPRWNTHLDDGTPLVSASTHAIDESYAVLLLDMSMPPDTLVTARHAHLPHDSFVPAPLLQAAKSGVKRRNKNG